ncbi:MAG: hypothetical protein JO250_17360 [Armatimonadetes bacterium]|nr:hypothetical protein [Armatimonadota bacterium]
MGEMMARGSTMIGMLVGVACQAIGRDALWPRVDHLRAAQARAASRRLEAISAHYVPYADVVQEEEWAGQAGLMEIFHHPNWKADPLSGLDSAATYGQMLCTAFAGGKFRDASSKTRNALLRTALALRAYRLEHGAYPATLGALVSSELSHVPDDPFALSGPFHYRRQGNGYVLHSVGPDSKDDGGRAIFDGGRAIFDGGRAIFDGGRAIFDATKPTPKPGERDQRRWVQEDSTGDIVARVNTQ